jgi:hypothetical protein
MESIWKAFFNPPSEIREEIKEILVIINEQPLVPFAM